MKQNNTFQNFILFLLFFLPLFAFSQETIKGTVNQTGTNEALSGANVLIKGTSIGTITDFDGNFSIDVETLPVTIVVSSTGSVTKEIEVNSSQMISISLDEGLALDEVVLVGNRSKPRTAMTSLVPIDNISATELRSTGKETVDKMLTYKVPSFNSTNQTISDATAHFDPADLRGLGPSRTLVLVNGKRKNQSALVYINDTPGKGEVGVDLKSIPAAALKNVEVLRDGASAQYGSDAIAGVINMVLRENVGTTNVNLTTGITTEGDGFNLGADVNTGFAIGDNGGFLNVTLGYYQQEETNRAGSPGSDVLFGVEADDPVWGDWLSQNPDLGMTIGQPKLQKGDLFYNLGIPLSNEKAKLYSFGGYTYREGTSYALYRAPYWVGSENNPLYDGVGEYQGFQPTFETQVNDNYNTVGVELDLLGFDVDVSGTYGRNAVDYEVGNSINVSLGDDSPTRFDVGAYSFSSMLANLDINRTFGNFNVGFGAEMRKETFEAVAGQEESWIDGGAQSFPGLQPANALKEDRNSAGLYADVEWDATDKLLFGGAIRYEDFSDFGDNTSWKLSGRYILGDNRGALRASLGTGFRAPSLHQIYLSNIQTLISGGTVSNQGTFNNVDPVIRDGLGVPQLSAETSQNFSAGITYKVTPKIAVTADFYQVTVDDRVLFSGEIGFDGDDTTINPVEEILIDYEVTSLKFFTNAVDTKTSGIDIVATLNRVNLGSGTFGASLAYNYNKTSIEGEISTPAILADNGYEIFNRKEESRITSSRPQSKAILGLNYNINKWNFTLNNTYFGEVTWQHSDNGLNGAPLGPGGSNLPTDDAAYDQTFGGKVLTDLIVNYKFNSKLTAFVAFNNLFNVYPDTIDTKGDFVTDLGGRFKYPWEVNQFGFNGTIINGGVSFSF